MKNKKTAVTSRGRFKFQLFIFIFLVFCVFCKYTHRSKFHHAKKTSILFIFDSKGDLNEFFYVTCTLKTFFKLCIWPSRIPDRPIRLSSPWSLELRWVRSLEEEHWGNKQLHYNKHMFWSNAIQNKGFFQYVCLPDSSLYKLQ